MMVFVEAEDLYRDTIPVPRATRFPVELRPPAGFRLDDPHTWPSVEGSLEYVGGRLLYMPPSGDVQQDVSTAVAGLLDRWLDQHPEFVVGTNEAGMLLGDEVRAADAAVWLRNSLGQHTGGYRTVPPLLAVEIAGSGQAEEELREKARWYLRHGVAVVWIVLPEQREVVVITAQQQERHTGGQALAAHPSLPDLTPDVDTFFRHLR